MADAQRSQHAEPLHLLPTAELAERVLLPGDPGRALSLAQSLLSAPRMFNHNRGLWGYTGTAGDGRPLTIQSTGMGGPSAAIVMSELIGLGARRAIRVGTCGAVVRGLSLGDLVVAREAICADGTSRALGAGERVGADGPLTERLRERAAPAQAGAIVSVDLFYEPDADAVARDRSRRGALAIEMEAATLFALGAKAGVAVACVLVVSDVFDAGGERSRIDAESLVGAAQTMGSAAIAALSE